MEENKNTQSQSNNFFVDHLPAIISLAIFAFVFIAKICLLAGSISAANWLYFIGSVCAFVGICWKMVLGLIKNKLSFDIDMFVCLVCLAVAIF